MLLFIVVLILALIYFFNVPSGGSGDYHDYGSGEKEPHGWGGSCNGDCANCPPHYGYRHGRYYYGHDHHHGCEFGGNRGSGSMD